MSAACSAQKGRNWLFFGERSAATDYLYRDELESMNADGHLMRLDTAFSRDSDDKVYVQDRMLEHAPLFWQWLEDGASVYVCGDASRMAKDVHGALCRIVKEQGVMSQEAAETYVDALKGSASLPSRCLLKGSSRRCDQMRLIERVLRNGHA